MLRQFSAGLPTKARASCSKVLGQAAKFSLARRSMATVKVKGIEKVIYNNNLALIYTEWSR
jgi:processing peptidase subunit alpha